MKLLLDTAHLSDITVARDGGILDGVAAYPSPAAVESLFPPPLTELEMGPLQRRLGGVPGRSGRHTRLSLAERTV